MATRPRAPNPSRPRKPSAPVFSGDALGDENDRGEPPVLTDAVEREDEDRQAGELVPDITEASLQQREIPSFSESREARIAEAAYWRAERRGFAPGHELDDWLDAEREIDSDPSKDDVPKTG